MFLYIAIISYILSNIISLALLFTGKKLGHSWFRMFVAVHVLLGIIFLFNFITDKGASPRYISFLVFFCSGIITGGLALGTKKNLLVRIYFGIFCISVFVFIVSPSYLLNFLMTANFSRSSGMIAVKNNFFLEKQSNAFSGDTADIRYKLIEKNGMFHRTIVRDIDFHGALDSIKLISYEEKRSAVVRGYSNRKNFVEAITDSVDVNLDLNPQKKDEIERRL